MARTASRNVISKPRQAAASIRRIGLLAFVLAAASAGHAGEPCVSGLNQLVVVDPAVHERGLPSARIVDGANGPVVGLPAAVHVHRYYYSGDQQFQGPILRGGPTIIAANHPKTGERTYVEVTLPPGAPLIVHNSGGITYVYEDRRVCIEYSAWHPERVCVKHLEGRGVMRRTGELVAGATHAVHERVSESALVGAVGETATGLGKTVRGAVGATGAVAAGALQRANAAAELVPGVTALKSVADEEPYRLYEGQIEKALRDKEAAEPEFVPTIR